MYFFYCSCDSTNYVGKLNEWCLKNKMDYPVYTFISKDGTSFETKCALNGYGVFLATATSKKTSKQLSAKEFLKVFGLIKYE